MSSRLLAGLHKSIRPYAQGLFELASRVPGAVVTSARRSRADQTRLYLQRRFSRFPAARPGHSKHERGLAFDLGGLSASQLRRFGRLWESWGGRWGGRFRPKSDPIHFEA